jgi:hypothetical protein
MATNMTKAIKKVEQAEAKSQQSSAVKKATENYKQLTVAIREYQKATATGNTEQQKYWNGRINSAKAELDLQKKNINTISDENGQRTKTLDILNRGNNALDAHNKKISEGNKVSEQLGKNFDNIYQKLKIIATVSLAKMWYDALQ